mmetsp:Transcript_34357/g.52644  ORF Transcript_34357/g.52644 Transcript_34357/m.52644 type:complete len:112 (-) Transcript_34357:6245-6580(-)
MLIEKCLGHMKPQIKGKATECLMLTYEASETFDESFETLLAYSKHKNVKVMTSGTQAVALLVENFGPKRFDIREFSEQMLKNATSTNPGVKNASYDYYKAVYKWIGDALLP